MSKHIYSIAGVNNHNYYATYELAVAALGAAYAPAIGDSNYANGEDENSSPRFEAFPHPRRAPTVAYIRRHALIEA